MGYRLKVIVFLLAVILTACTNVPERDVRTRACAEMPKGRASACACVCEGKAYVFAGRGAGSKYLNDLWMYDPASDSWTDLGAGPMKARVNAAIAAVDDKVYMGLGYGASHAYNDSAYLRDWYQYTPETKQWKRLADYPLNYTVAPVTFAVGGSIYAVYGFWYGFWRHVCRYDIASDSWTVYPDNEARAVMHFGGCGTLFEGLLYYGGGYNTYNLNHWYAVDIEKDVWTARASIPGKGRELSACTAGKEHVYIFGGRHFGGDMTGGEVFESYLRYAPAKDAWEWCGTMPCGRAENQIAFSINGTPYFGLGEDENGKVIGSLYRIED